MDDPIFDPWCLDDASASQPPRDSPSAPSRWRNASKGPPVPAQRPVPRPIERNTEEAAAPSDAHELVLADDVEGGTLSEASESGEPAGPPAEDSASAETAEDGVSAELGDATGFLRALLMPRIDALSLRLATARHRTTVDDRLDQDPPGLRFRIQPWSGPFDPTNEQTAAVLELVLEGGRHGALAVRIWLDPASKAPTERRAMAADRLTESWVDRLLLDFVEAALSG